MNQKYGRLTCIGNGMVLVEIVVDLSHSCATFSDSHASDGWWLSKCTMIWHYAVSASQKLYKEMIYVR